VGTFDALFERGQIAPREEWTVFKVHEPPGKGDDGDDADVHADNQVPNEEPRVNDRFRRGSRALSHDVAIRFVEPERGGG